MLRLGALALAFVLVPASALAHGGPPVVENLAFDPSDPTHVLAGTNFGDMVSHDGGVTWSWICPSVVQLRPAVEDPLVLTTEMGTLFIGDTAGLWRGTGDACDWESVLAAPGTTTAGAVAHGGPGVLFAGTGTDGGSNSVLRSTDDGRTWNGVLGPTLGVWFESIRSAPSMPTRVYAVQNRPPLRAEPWETTVWRSDDGGDHWTSAPFTLLAHEWRLYLLAIDPSHPDHLIGYTQNLYPGEHARVMLSEDGGQSWSSVQELTQVLGGAWASDGAVYVAGPVDGLYRSDDGGHHFTGIRTDLSLRCVVETSEGLWVCADDFTDGFAIGRSSDRGSTFTPVARLRSITGMPTCAATSDLATTCPAEQSMLDATLALAPGDDAGIDPDASVRDAGADAGSAPPARTCGCHAAGRPGGAGLLGLLALGALTKIRSIGRRRAGERRRSR